MFSLLSFFFGHACNQCSEMAVIRSSKKETTPEGFTRLDRNLNEGSLGEATFLCIKRVPFQLSVPPPAAQPQPAAAQPAAAAGHSFDDYAHMGEAHRAAQASAAAVSPSVRLPLFFNYLFIYL